MIVNRFGLLLKLLLTLSTYFYGHKVWNSFLYPSVACMDQSVDVRCSGYNCMTNKVTISGSLCSNYVDIKILACHLRDSNRYVWMYINGRWYKCNPPYSSSYEYGSNWYNCGRYYFSSGRFSVYLQSRWASRYCYNSPATSGHFTVYGRIRFRANYYNVNAPTTVPTSSPTMNPTEKPTPLPTRNPTNLPTSLSPTMAPTGSPCVNKYSWCGVAESKGLCYDENRDTRILVISDCPVSCDTCFNLTLSPTGVPTFLPTLSPTFPTMSPSRKPSRQPTPFPTVLPTVSPTCIDTIPFCDVIASFCNSSISKTKLEMSIQCASTCGYCTLEPTQFPTVAPSNPCNDLYTYCTPLTLNGACYDENWHARLHFQNDCPLSCGTCDNRTVSPTSLPSPQPTINPTTPTSAPSVSPSRKPSPDPTLIPTASPTCVDKVTYCNVIKSYCKAADVGTLSKMLADCSATCGYCTLQPSRVPTPSPSNIPTGSPSANPMLSPSTIPSIIPTPIPSSPTGSPSWLPTTSPTLPTIEPTELSSLQPSIFPTVGPTISPTNGPSTSPSSRPSEYPSLGPSTTPSLHPTQFPTTIPSNSPTQCEDLFVLCSELAQTGACYLDDHDLRKEFHKDCPVSCGTCYNNTVSPTASPSIWPSTSPTAFPSITPSASPSKQPLLYSTQVPTSEPTCAADSLAYCRIMTRYCFSKNPVKARIVRKHCAVSCGICNSSSSNDQSLSVNGGKPEVRRRKETTESITSTVSSPSLVKDKTRIELQSRPQSLHYVWIAILIGCMFGSLVALMRKFLYINRQRKRTTEILLY